MISKRLGFELAVQEYREEFRCVDSQELQLGVDPVVALTGDGVWSPDVDPAKNAVLREGVDFELQKSNNVLFKPDGWALGFVADWTIFVPSALPDWIVQYISGYWLPTMTGTRPAGAEDLPGNLDLAAWTQFQHLYTIGKVNPQVRGFSKGGARTDFRQSITAWHPVADEILSTFGEAVI